MEIKEEIAVFGARVHNLKNVDICIPRNKLTVITGISGSGKSSLAFDTIHAEGQRRYIETFSAYARQFLGNIERPDVDEITGLSPVISIEQKTTNKNPRSTVGTVTEIYDFLRLLYARAGIAYSYVTGKPMVKYSDEQIKNLVFDEFVSKKVLILAPLIKGRKGHYKELFEQMRKKGYLYVRINGTVRELTPGLKTDRYKAHYIELVIDRLKIEEGSEKRVKSAIDIGMKYGKGIILVLNAETNIGRYFSRELMCPESGISYNEPAPNSFSFNSPQGSCPVCNGLGEIKEMDMSKIIPDTGLSIYKGGITPLGAYKSSLIFWQIEAIAHKYDFSLKDAINTIPETALNIILYGSGETFRLVNTPLGNFSNYLMSFDGIISYIEKTQKDGHSKTKSRWTDQFVSKKTCPECNGTRLRKESLQFKIAGENIAFLSGMDISELHEWLKDLPDKLSQRQTKIASEIIKEILDRCDFLLDVGLNYLSLNRSSKSLSGGESQRIRLATQIGSKLVNVLYILDEPSIGLHQRDNLRLINSLKTLRDNKNSIIVVEHDKEMICAADYVVDIGPGAGRLGGKITFSGTVDDLKKSDSLTAAYLTGKKTLEMPETRRTGSGKNLKLFGASGNNLKNVDLVLPLGKLICVTGVSGSGKSSLINETLHPILSALFYRSLDEPLPYNSISGLENIDKVIEVDQSPLGRTPRSNPATYTGVFGDIRKLFEIVPEAKIRGYKSGRFSFNVKGGRCETCQGAGLKTIEMNFLPDVYVQCDQCFGKRYNRETLEIRYKGKNINDVLNMTINQAVVFFSNIPSIIKKIQALQDVGLGYITLGQPSTTLSGGESQRVKLAAELAKKDTGKTVYIFDEPTTGLHFEDIRVLMSVLNKLVDKGNTIIIIEHNIDVIKMADHIIDMGPEGGRNGGEIIATGSPEEIINSKKSYTATFLEKAMTMQHA